MLDGLLFYILVGHYFEWNLFLVFSVSCQQLNQQLVLKMDRPNYTDGFNISYRAVEQADLVDLSVVKVEAEEVPPSITMFRSSHESSSVLTDNMLFKAQNDEVSFLIENDLTLTQRSNQFD